MGWAGSDAAGRGLSQPPAEAAEAAEEAGLRYTSDSEPGIRRVGKGRSFEYVRPDGTRITDAPTLGRIRGLVIPPAWTRVWICTDPRGHLQATGHDARGRKQYRYHPRWRALRDADKFSRLIGFARALPRIRRRVARDLKLPDLPREKVVATIVRLLETTYARIGNEEYERENKSYGLTTLRNQHVKVKGSSVQFLFRGKSGKQVQLGVTDPRVARVVKRCEELPGQRLFQYVDAEGAVHHVHSEDVNAYLKETTGDNYTAKDFRTWAATVLAACELRSAAAYRSETEAKRNVVAAINLVAQRLGHTPAICRKSYVHPAVVETYLDGGFEKVLRQTMVYKANRTLRADELAVVALLERKARSKVGNGAARLSRYGPGRIAHAA